MNEIIARTAAQTSNIRLHRMGLLALASLIHAEVAPKLAAKIKAESFLMGGNRTERQGFVMDLGKYGYGTGYALRSEVMPDLAGENEPRFAMLQESAKIAEKA